jgi:hypothetical protein
MTLRVSALSAGWSPITPQENSWYSFMYIKVTTSTEAEEEYFCGASSLKRKIVIEVTMKTE